MNNRIEAVRGRIVNHRRDYIGIRSFFRTKTGVADWRVWRRLDTGILRRSNLLNTEIIHTKTTKDNNEKQQS